MTKISHGLPLLSVTSFCPCVPCLDFWPSAQTDVYISLPLVAPCELCLSSCCNFAIPCQALTLLDMPDLLSLSRGLGLRLWSCTGLGLSHPALFFVHSIAILGIVAHQKPQHRPFCTVRSVEALACKVVGGWSAEMTGGVLARHTVSLVLMVVTKAGWLRKLNVWWTQLGIGRQGSGP